MVVALQLVLTTLGHLNQEFVVIRFVHIWLVNRGLIICVYMYFFFFFLNTLTLTCLTKFDNTQLAFMLSK